MTASAEGSAEERSPDERSPDERIKMTVTERSIGTLTTALQDWLTDRLGRPGQLTVSGVRMPGSGGLSSTSALFEASWISQGTRQCGAYVARMAPRLHGPARPDRIRGLVFCRALSLYRAPGPGGRGTHLDAELEHVTVFL